MHKIINQPMVDVVSPLTNVEVLDFYSDASAAIDLGFGCILDRSWLCKKWEPGFIQEKEPSIEYLELFALIAGVLTWSETKLANRRVAIFCDNMAVVHMVNKNASTCRHCITLLRLLVLNCLTHNCRLIQVSLGIYRVFQTFFWPAEFPGYHQCQQESQ